MKLAVAVVLLGACVTPSGDDVTTSDTSQAIDSSNGTSLNGTSLNGTSLNGTSLNGTSLNGTSLNGTSLNGTSLNGTSLNGTSLDSATVVGSTWTGTASNGAAVQLRLDSATRAPAPDDDTWFYGVSYQADGAWNSLCGVDDTGAPILAVAVPGVWGAGATYQASSSQFTFACRAKSVAKCVELGYKPWAGRADYMASCVRMLRADYCGDGTSFTKDGTLLNVYDDAGIQLDAESWDVEAGWSPAGATCVTTGSSTRFKILQTGTPSCYAAVKTNACDFRSGALIIDEVSARVIRGED